MTAEQQEVTRPMGRVVMAELDVATVARIDRAEGALLGVLAGDALGWRVEAGGTFLGLHLHHGRHAAQPRATVEVHFAPQAPPTGAHDRAKHHGPQAHEPHGFAHWRFPGSTEDVLPGETSDDSQLTIAVARARVCGGIERATDWWPVWTETELPLWWLGERGGGRATRDAAATWALQRAPWDHDEPSALRAYFHSGGNGVAVRVVPHVIAHLPSSTPEALLKDTFLDGVTTHGHPRALIGAQVLALAGYLLGRGTPGRSGFERPGALIEAVLDHFPWHPPQALPVWWKAADQALQRRHEDEWREVGEEMRRLLEQVLALIADGASADVVVDELGARGPMGGAGTISVATALHHVSRWLHDPEVGPAGAVIYAANATFTDADSIASMVGGLCGLALGRSWQPREWDLVQDAGLARSLAAKIVTGLVDPAPRPVHELDLVRIRAALTAGRTEVELDGARTAYVQQPPNHERGASGEYMRWRLDTSDGQRIYVRI